MHAMLSLVSVGVTARMQCLINVLLIMYLLFRRKSDTEEPDTNLTYM